MVMMMMTAADSYRVRLTFKLVNCESVTASLKYDIFQLFFLYFSCKIYSPSFISLCVRFIFGKLGFMYYIYIITSGGETGSASRNGVSR